MQYFGQRMEEYKGIHIGEEKEEEEEEKENKRKRMKCESETRGGGRILSTISISSHLLLVDEWTKGTRG